ncbi:hypothetical protein PHYSODRAFT_256680 [Phytophthora sojae]|uniref:NADP-dependent oxidoreductase domain-containing protein n=1 Tax=Phytophthora sojae (strain P6497) TaxID=1094619 RepID=G5A1I2_PHYSP|nr:hypothetical protein PHYSODRAFT_256680 [Phytophthora sojae]EGZ10780.1 hypothetical protein PHYSODRAFT_256680 [Phytophthora sojae]|eukprot:XP_009533525.1 hypothetical protein PHYSODRAFT_256680 [Phytophthora sojae]
MALSSTSSTTAMTHRFLGNSGLLVSKLSLGSWVDYNDKYTVDGWYDMMKIAFEHDVNFYDTAEMYGNGQAEELLGGAIKKGIKEGVWTREDLVISTKLFTGTKGVMQGGPNDEGVSRKHIVEGLKASLRRLELDYVDVVFCHRFDAYTPIEETVRAMNFVINQGWAFYWGTSDLRDRGLTRTDPPHRGAVAVQHPRAQQGGVRVPRSVQEVQAGLTTWSPLAYGTLTGKYSAGKPEGSRYTTSMFATGPFSEGFAERVEMADRLVPIAKELGTSLAQMSIAWAVSNENVSTVLLGASRPAQLEENLKALEVVSKITPEVKAKINAAVNRGRHL